MILNRGQGPAGRILSPASFDLMARPVIGGAFGQDLSYGYGTTIQEVDGHIYLGHGGGAPGYGSAVMADTDAGLGVAVLINHGRTALHIEVAHIALRLLRAIVDKAPLPALLPPRDPTTIANAADDAGACRCGDRTLVLEAETDRLILRHGAERIALERRGSDTFYIDHPDWALFLLRLERAGGQVVEAYHGPHWYMHQRYSGPTSFVTPPQWNAYPGHYRSHHCLQVKVSIQMSRTRIFAIQGGPEGVLLPVQRMRGGPLVPGVDAAPRSCRAITARRQKLPLKSGENALDNDQKSLTCRKCH